VDARENPMASLGAHRCLGVAHDPPGSPPVDPVDAASEAERLRSRARCITSDKAPDTVLTSATAAGERSEVAASIRSDGLKRGPTDSAESPGESRAEG